MGTNDNSGFLFMFVTDCYAIFGNSNKYFVDSIYCFTNDISSYIGVEVFKRIETIYFNTDKLDDNY